MSCQCQRKKMYEYEKIKELAGKMAKLEGKTYYLYKKNNKEYDFAPFDVQCPERVLAVEFIYPLP